MNTRTVSIVAAVAALAALGVVLLRPVASAAGTSDDLPSYLRFTGTGIVTAAPDTALITVTTTGEAATSKEALDESSVAMKAVLARLQGLKQPEIADADVQSQGVSSYRDGTGERLHHASNSVQVTLHDPNAAGAVIAAANAAGAEQVGGPTFALEDRSAAASEAIREAIADARLRADAAAADMGVRVTRLVSLSDVEPEGTAVAYQGAFAAAPDGGALRSAAVPTPEGTLEVRVRLVATFAHSG